ncbi:dephospho-CoA kinase [Cognatishimia sp. SS12]|uniref:dephospho-CoA kinase n=1 Tax=Cognatishimia sp. SS12 TaxID=2979465 RepID=UPI00232D73F7|nr:dephospho-CoA kinase [Cognatishimia sp. SS12]MDC0737744.1 dephospho-CoA kinase [Cognatishimia sp. SS12]
MTFKLGLTGSIGMGKSTTAQLFADAGCAVWDADAAVHRMYSENGAAVSLIAVAFPSAVKDNAVSRDALRRLVAGDAAALKRLERIVHPLVAADRDAFIAASAADVTVLDIPLLFENGTEANMDAVVCVTSPPEIQRARVLARGTMTEKQFEAILAKQLPNEEKLAKSDYVVLTDTFDHAREQVARILADIRGKMANA